MLLLPFFPHKLHATIKGARLIKLKNALDMGMNLLNIRTLIEQVLPIFILTLAKNTIRIARKTHWISLSFVGSLF